MDDPGVIDQFSALAMRDALIAARLLKMKFPVEWMKESLEMCFKHNIHSWSEWQGLSTRTRTCMACKTVEHQ